MEFWGGPRLESCEQFSKLLEQALPWYHTCACHMWNRVLTDDEIGIVRTTSPKDWPESLWTAYVDG